MTTENHKEKRNGILICGLNGAGKSTLGRALAKALRYRFIDIEDLCFPKDDPDDWYANPRSSEEVKSMLADMTAKSDPFVLAAVRGIFGEAIISRFRAAVYLEVPKEVRMQRVYLRAYSQFGERICEGGDCYEREAAFFRFVQSREEDTVEKWLRSVSCRVIRMDGTLPVCDTVNRLAELLHDDMEAAQAK